MRTYGAAATTELGIESDMYLQMSYLIKETSRYGWCFNVVGVDIPHEAEVLSVYLNIFQIPLIGWDNYKTSLVEDLRPNYIRTSMASVTEVIKVWTHSNAIHKSLSL